jgi:hypothetical protein
MLVIAPKDNLVTTFPTRVVVVIEPSRGGAVVDPIRFDELSAAWRILRRVARIKRAERGGHWFPGTSGRDRLRQQCL